MTQESFEKFLKREADYTFTEGMQSEDKYISTRELGEWAWKRLEADIELRYGNTWDEEELLKEIAVACLGEAEVKARLEKLEKAALK